MRIAGRIRSLLEARLPEGVVGFGLLLAALDVADLVLFADPGSGAVLSSTTLVGLTTSAPFIAGIVYGGYWLHGSEVPPGQYPRVAAWLVGGLGVFTVINVLAMAVEPPESLRVLSGWLRWTAAIGAGIGLLVGTIEARAIERNRRAERAAVRAEVAESERELLDYVNSLLRHEVLNAANVIDGNATLLMEDHDPQSEAHERLRVVRRQSEDLAQVIEDVRVLLRTAGGPTEFEPRNLGALLDEEVAALRERTVGVDVSQEGPCDVEVRGDDLLPRLFANLLSNAVEHNDSDRPAVDVTIEPAGEDVRVHVSDNGPGIDESTRETLFARERDSSSSHHLGLFLVKTLAERYGGDVWVSESGPEGTTFTVELPRADADA